MSEIDVDLINQAIQTSFIKHDWVNYNSNLTSFDKCSIVMSVPPIISDYGIDYNAKILSNLIDEMNSNIYRKITKKLFDTCNFEYINLKDISKAHINDVGLKRIIDMISSIDLNNLIVNSNLGSLLQDSALFHFSPVSLDLKQYHTGVIYKIGSIYSKDIWIDPYMKFDENIICMFDKVDINLANLNISLTTPPHNLSFNNRVLVSFDLDFNVGDSKLIFVIDDVSSTAFNHYKSLQRDIKIDDILN